MIIADCLCALPIGTERPGRRDRTSEDPDCRGNVVIVTTLVGLRGLELRSRMRLLPSGATAAERHRVPSRAAERRPVRLQEGCKGDDRRTRSGRSRAKPWHLLGLAAAISTRTGLTVRVRTAVTSVPHARGPRSLHGGLRRPLTLTRRALPGLPAARRRPVRAPRGRRPDGRAGRTSGAPPRRGGGAPASAWR